MGCGVHFSLSALPSLCDPLSRPSRPPPPTPSPTPLYTQHTYSCNECNVYTIVCREKICSFPSPCHPDCALPVKLILLSDLLPLRRSSKLETTTINLP